MKDRLRLNDLQIKENRIMSAHDGYKPLQNFLDKFPKISGNTVNGLGEKEERRPSPFFWHPHDRQTHGKANN